MTRNNSCVPLSNHLLPHVKPFLSTDKVCILVLLIIVTYKHHACHFIRFFPLSQVVYIQKAFLFIILFVYTSSDIPLPSSPSQTHQTQTDGRCQQELADRSLYSCLLRGSASAEQIQKWMLTEHKVPNEGARERNQGVEGVCNPIGGTTI